MPVALTSSPEFNGSAIGAQGVNLALQNVILMLMELLRVALELASALVNAEIHSFSLIIIEVLATSVLIHPSASLHVFSTKL